MAHNKIQKLKIPGLNPTNKLRKKNNNFKETRQLIHYNFILKMKITQKNHTTQSIKIYKFKHKKILHFILILQSKKKIKNHNQN